MKVSLKILSVIFVLVFVFCFTACSEQSATESGIAEQSNVISDSDIDIDDSDAQSSSDEEILSGTVIEENGNEKITREYRDGENDYTITTETFFDDGTLHQKVVMVYKNRVLAERSRSYYYVDGGYDKSFEKFDIDGLLIELTEEEYRGKYIYVSNLILDGNLDYPENYIANVEFYSKSRELVARGFFYSEVINDTQCIIQDLDVLQDGQIVHKQRTVSSVDPSAYNLYQIIDLENNVVFSKENSNKREIITIYGNDGFRAETENGYSVYTDADGKVIAEVDGTNIVKIGKEYTVDNIVSAIEDKIAKMQNYITVLISLN